MLVVLAVALAAMAAPNDFDQDGDLIMDDANPELDLNVAAVQWGPTS